MMVPGRLHFTDVTDMRFVFDAKKTAQAAAYLVQLNDGTLNYMKLLKLLYLADRQSLIDTGLPITGDKWVSMDHGPVLSGIYGQITMGRPILGSSPWYEYITEADGFDVSVARAPETDQLSKYEVSLLNEVFTRFGKMNKWTLVQWTHGLPEWDDPKGSSLPIDPERILREVGRSRQEIEEINDDAEEMYFIQNLAKMVR